MSPVATYCRWKSAALASWQIPFALMALVVALGVVPYFVAVEVVGREHGSWMLLIVGIMPLLIGGLSLASGVRAARAAFEKDCWLKAGPEGISCRVPENTRRSAWSFAYDLEERFVPWADVDKWYEHVSRVNGIPMSRRLVFRTKRGPNLTLEGVYFSESIDQISSHISEAARLAG
jgi:hypothetical protein